MSKDLFPAYCISLAKRPERAQLMSTNWNNKVKLIIVSGTDLSAQKQGTKGCFLSHQQCFNFISAQHLYYGTLGIIMEDDIVPCSDFVERLELFLNELPQNWDVFMLGHSVHQHSGHSQVSAHIHKANKWVGAGHCYIINPKSFDMYRELLYNEKLHEYNFDVLLNHLQKNHNVYMAMPSLCYQYSSYSDNSGMLLDNTKYTETFFKDKLEE